MISNHGPNPVYGEPISPLTLPASTGLGSTTQADAVCFGATTRASGALKTQTTSDGWTVFESPVAGATGSLSTQTGDATLVENTHFPAGATRIRVLFQLPFEVTTNTATGITSPFGFQALKIGITGSLTAIFTELYAEPHTVSTYSSSNDITQLNWVIDIELPTTYPTLSVTPTSYDLHYVIGPILGGGLPGNFAISAPTVTVIAFKYEE